MGRWREGIVVCRNAAIRVTGPGHFFGGQTGFPIIEERNTGQLGRRAPEETTDGCGVREIIGVGDGGDRIHKIDDPLDL